MLNLDEWVAQNYPDPDLIWAEAAVNQFKTFKEVAEEIEWLCKVAGHHTSKSCKLPVVCFDYLKLKIYIRDNYYGANLAVDSDLSLNIDYKDIYIEKDWDWYLKEVEKKADYCWNGWTEEEINDPRISRVIQKRVDGSEYWPSDKTIEEKERWINRFKNPKWWTKDWSHGELIVEGEFGPGCKIYIADAGYQEGIAEAMGLNRYHHLPSYNKDDKNKTKRFSISIDSDRVSLVKHINIILNAYYKAVGIL